MFTDYYYLHLLIIPTTLFIMAEAVFCGVWWRRYYLFNKGWMPHVPTRSFNPRHAFDEFVIRHKRMSRYICIKDFLKTWFFNAPLEQIKRGNMAEFLAYGFYYKTREQLRDEHSIHGRELVSEFEQAWNIKFEEGYNEKIKFMAHIWEPLRCNYRPFVFYLFIDCIYFVKHLVLTRIGFRFYRSGNFTYYGYSLDHSHKNKKDNKNKNKNGNRNRNDNKNEKDKERKKEKGKEKEKEKETILFWHGTGIGLLHYKEFLKRLIQTGQPVIAFESPYLGMRFSSLFNIMKVPHIPDPDEVVDGLLVILAKHRIKRVCVGAHSYGTLYVSRFLQRHPEYIQSVYFIDPVNFFMFTGKTIYNFYYSPETETDPITTFVARDIHHAATLSRRFYWSVLNN